MPDASQREHLFDVLDEFDTAMLVSGPSGDCMHGRPMAVGELQRDGIAYFAARRHSEKVSEMLNNPHVTLTFQGRARFASANGLAEVTQDRALIDRLWKEAWRVWVPKGKDDPDLCIIRVEVQHGEYWDNAGVKGVKYAMQAAKAYLTGDTPHADAGQHGKVKS